MTTSTGVQLGPVTVPDEWSGRPAIRDSRQTVTYQGLVERVGRRTAELADLVGPGRLVALERTKDIAFVTDVLAVMELGGVFVPLDPAGPPGRMAAMRDRIAPDVTITPDGITRHAPRTTPLPADAAYVFATSGSTGHPKPVVGSRESLLTYLDWFADTFRFTEDERFASLTSLGFDVVIRDMFQPLSIGATLVIPRISPPDVSWLSAEGITAMNAVPALVRSWLRHAEQPCPSVRTLFFAGEAITGELVREIPRLFPGLEQLVTYFGTTETTLPKFHHILTPGSAPDGMLHAGRPVLPETEARIVDGEVVVVSRHMAHGYLDLPELTAERFARQPDGRVAYRTGDRGHLDDDGNLMIRGRIDDEVKINGVRIHPAEVTAAVRRHVRDAVVLSVPKPAGGHQLVAFIEAAADLDVARLRETLLDDLQPAALPTRMIVRPDGFPRLYNGKPDRFGLLAMLAAETAADGTDDTEQDVVSDDPLEAALTALWSELLGVDAGPTTDFFGAGGDSLVAQRLVARAGAELGVDLGLRTLFAHPTPRALAEAAERCRPAAPAPTGPVDTTGITPVRRRLFFLQELDPEDTSYLLVNRIRLHGTVDEGRVRDAVAVLLRRHQELCTRYAVVDGEPHSLVDPSPATPFHLVSSMDDLAPRPFDLTEELPIRVQLLREGPDRAVLQFCTHHIASDAESSRLLVDEFFAAYHCRALPALPVLPAATAFDPTARLAYWTAALDGAPAVLELPTARPRAATRDTTGGRVSFDLDAGLIRAAAAELGTTPFAVLVTAFAHVLGRHAATTDVVLGTAVSTRDTAVAAGHIGCFIDTLVLRLDQAGPKRVRDLVARNAETVATARDHLLPFDSLVRALRPDRHPAVPPLVQALFTFHAEAAPDPGPGLRAEVLATPVAGAKLDLTCTVMDDGAGFTGEIVYATALFDAEFATRIGEHFLATLTALMSDVDGPVTGLPPVPARDHVTLTGTVPEPRANPLLHQRFECAARQWPDNVAVRCRDSTISYAGLNDRANALARHLRGRGVTTGSVVALLLERSIDMVTALLAVAKSGAAYVPLDPMHPPAHTAAVLAESGATLLVTHHEVADRPALPTVVLDELDLTGRHGDLELAVAPDDVLYVLFTSGSTGRPKGVVVRHGHLAAYLASFVDLLDLPDGLRYATLSTFAADLGLTNLVCALATGGALTVVPYEDATDPDVLAAYLRAHPVDVVKLVPSHLKAMREAGVLADVLPSRHLVLAGEPCPPDLVRSVRETGVGCAVWNNYGPTETVVSVLAHRIADELGESVPLGLPLAHVRVDVVDAELRPVPVGTPGELLISGHSVADYLSTQDGSTRFVDHPWLPGVRSYRSGDRVRRGPDGLVDYLGRTDRQVKIRGYRVEPGHVEAVLRRHPAVAEVAVVPRPGPDGRDALVAYWVPVDDHDHAGLSSFARAELASHLVPSAFVALDRLPITSNGKLDERALPAHTGGGASTSVAPRDEVEAGLAEIWRELLCRPDIGIDDDFFDLGGDSFTAMRLARRVPGLRVVTVFQRPTVRALAEVLRGPADDGLLVRLSAPRAGAALTSVVAVPFGGGSASAYRELATALPAEFDVHAVALPGHDLGATDQPLMPLVDLVEAVVRETRERVTGPIVVYGHCLGAAAAVAVAHRLVDDGADVLGVVIGGAFPAPRLPGRLFTFLARVLPSDRWTSDRLYRDTLRGIGGLTEELGEEDLAFVLRAVRHDSREAEEYYSTADLPGRVPLRALCVVGEWDRITEFHAERHREWGDYALDTETAVIPDAGHFFMRDQAEQLAGQLAGWSRQRLTDRAPAVPAPGRRQPEHRSTDGRPTRRITSNGRLRAFTAVAVAQAVSMIGTRAVAFALGVWLYLRTGSVTDFATTLVCSVLPGLLALPIAGAAADRWNRRLVMVVGDVTALLGSALCLGVLMLGELRLWHIGVAAALGSVGTAFSQPAFIAATAQLVPKRYLSRVNGVSQALVAVAQVAGPLLGGALLVPLGLTGLLFLDVVTVVLSLVVLCLVRFPDLLFRRRDESVWQEITGGARYIARRAPMRAMVVFFLAYNLLLGVGLALLPPMILSFASAPMLGTVTMIGAAGGVAAGITLALWGGSARRATGMIGFVVLTGAGMAIAGLRPELSFVTCGLVCVTFSLAMINGHWLTLIQAKVGPELQGRVVAFNRMIANITEPLGYVLAGITADRLFGGTGHGMGLLLVGVGAGVTTLGVAGLRWRRLRYLEDLLPDHVPDALATWDREELQRRADLRERQEAAAPL